MQSDRSLALALWVGGWGRLLVMVKYFADAVPRALGDFVCALSGTDADVLASVSCAFTDVACGLDGVKGDEIAGTFADALGCRSGSLGGALADIAGSAADFIASAVAWGRCLRLGVLGENVLGADGKCQGEERDEQRGECVAHELGPPC